MITTLIFDVDDTLYDVSCGFTAHRNGLGAQSFMVERLGFDSYDDAKHIRDEYFERYHSTAKALTVAQHDGRLPPNAVFDPNELAEYWATSLDFTLLHRQDNCIDYPTFVQDLKECKLRLVAFSNGPGKYVRRVLQELDLFGTVFDDDKNGNSRSIFAVDDVLPYCKPEKEAFEIIFERVGCKAQQCVIIEDSMKNIRKAKELGMKTVLILGKGRRAAEAAGTVGVRTSSCNKSKDDKTCTTMTMTTTSSAADRSEATKPGDAPMANDPAVDVSIETVDELRTVLPGLWQTPAVFEPIV